MDPVKHRRDSHDGQIQPFSAILISLGVSVFGAGLAIAGEAPDESRTAQPIAVQQDGLGDYDEDFRTAADGAWSAKRNAAKTPSAGQSAELRTGTMTPQRLKALRALWQSDPAFARIDDLSDYGDDLRKVGDPALVAKTPSSERAG